MKFYTFFLKNYFVEYNNAYMYVRLWDVQLSVTEFKRKYILNVDDNIMVHVTRYLCKKLK